MSRFLFLIGSLIFLFPPAADARRVTIKMATLAPKGTNFHKILSEMGAEWKVLSDGKVRLKVFPGGVAGDDEAVVRKMRLGTIGGAMLTAAGGSFIDATSDGGASYGRSTPSRQSCAVLKPAWPHVLYGFPM